MLNTDSLSRFCRLLSSETPKVETIRSAIAIYAEDYHLVKSEAVIRDIGNNGEVPSQTLVLYDVTNGAQTGSALCFHYEVPREGDVTAYLYPHKNKSWSDDAKRELEIYTDIIFFYFGRLRFSEMIEKSAMTQYLTGLPNSGGYMKHCVSLFRQKKLSLFDAFYFNLRGMGLISKRFGLQNGDALIRQYAGKLRAFILADEGEIIGHLGGDNFTALIKKERAVDFTGYLTEGVVLTLEGEDGGVESVRLTACLGGWSIDASIHEPGDVISMPSIAYNVAKNVMHKPFYYLSEQMVEQVNRQKWIMTHFSQAIENEEYQVYYQPKVDSRTKKLVGAEGLVRWKHGDQMIPPGDFISVLERESATAKLDLYMLDHACRDIRQWIDDGLEPVQVSINISRRDLSVPNLAKKIENIIKRYHIDRSLIQIEITETVDEQEHGLMTAFLQNLWVMNISTAIDDFGSGYSSLSTLRNFQISMLKIDRSFINNEEFNKNDEIILSDIIHMAGQLGIEVITEGVENQDQLDFVNKVGCYLIQGYLYDKPLSETEFRNRLEKRIYE